MNKLNRVLITLLLYGGGYAAVQAQDAVSASGGNATGTGGKVSYTIGQAAYTNFGGEGGSINLGVQQPNLFITVGTEEAEITLSATLYPNPTHSSTYLKLEQQDPLSSRDQLSLSLFDVNGQLILQQDISSTITTIPMEQLHDALYILQIKKDNREIKSFKIFKTN